MCPPKPRPPAQPGCRVLELEDTRPQKCCPRMSPQSHTEQQAARGRVLLVWGPLRVKTLDWTVYPDPLYLIPTKFSKSRSMLKNANVQIDSEERRRDLKPLNTFVVILSTDLYAKAKCEQKVILLAWNQNQTNSPDILFFLNLQFQCLFLIPKLDSIQSKKSNRQRTANKCILHATFSQQDVAL